VHGLSLNKHTWYRTTITNILHECKERNSKSHHH
jgi:hypothetical protein